MIRLTPLALSFVSLILGLSLTLGAAMMAPSLALGQEEKLIQISRIKMAKGGKLSIDKRINKSLNKQLVSLQNLRLKKKDGTPYKPFQQFNLFSPLNVSKPSVAPISKKTLIPLNKTMFVEITIDPFKKDHYPARVRWFVKKNGREEEIVKVQQYKFTTTKCLFIVHLVSSNSATAELLAIEFISPKSS